VDILTAGDIVNDIGLDNTPFSFQPAASVQVVIKSGFMNGIGGYLKLTDGVKETYLWNGTTIYQGSGMSSIDVFINNTNYLKFDGLGVGKFAAYTGVQIK